MLQQQFLAVTLEDAVSSPQGELGTTSAVLSITHNNEDFVWSSRRDIMSWQQSLGPSSLETTDIICGIDSVFLQPFRK